MTQDHSVCQQLSTIIRSGTAGAIGNWKLLAMLSAIWWSSDVLANDSDGFSPHVILVVDESGSMHGRHDWLADALPALGNALNDRNVNILPDQMYFSLAGFTTRSRELVQHASEFDAARAVSALRTDGGGEEDGYIAIRDVLSGYLTGNVYAPTTVILITDEDRDVTDRELTLERLADQLIMNGIVVHAVVRARIVCPEQKVGIAIDQNRVAVTAGDDEFSTCSDARIQTFDEYAELAWATGGLVWSLDLITGGRKTKTNPVMLQQFVDVVADKVLLQWPTGVLWTDIDYWPKNPQPGDVVTFDGSHSLSNQPGRQISDWNWDLDGDGTMDQDGPTVARIYPNAGRYRIVLNVADNSNPPSAGRKVLFLQVSK